MPHSSQLRVLLLFLLLPALIAAQTQSAFGEDSALIRKQHVSAAYAFQGNSTIPSELRFFNREGQVTLYVMLNPLNGDTLQRYRNTYDKKGDLVLTDLVEPNKGKSSHTIIRNTYKNHVLATSRTEWRSDPDSLWSEMHYTYDSLGRKTGIDVQQRIAYDEKSPPSYRHYTVSYAYHGDTTLTWTDGSLEKKYARKDSAGNVIAERTNRYGSYYTAAAYSYDSLGHLSHMELLRETGEIYYWENYTCDANGLRTSYEVFYTAVSKKSAVGACTYRYEYW